MANSDPCLLLNSEHMYLVSILQWFLWASIWTIGSPILAPHFCDFVCLFVHKIDERFTYSSNVVLYFAHNVSQISRECTLFHVFSARVCRAGHFLHFPVFLRFRVLFRPGDRAMRNHAVTSRSLFKHPLNLSPAKYEAYTRRFVLFSFSSNTMVREGSHSNMFH